MKVLKVIGAALLLFSASQASALVDISGFGGYTTLGMGDLNKAVDNAVASGGSTASQKSQSGYYVGADAGFSTVPFLKIGPRLEFVQPGQASVTYASGNKFTVDSDLLLMELGLTVDTSIPMSGLSVIGGIWGGYGLAGAKNTQTFAGLSNSALGNGGGFVGEAAAQLRYGLVAGLSLGLDLGYRLANITNMENSTDSPFGPKKGDPFFKNSNGSTGAFDYSGLNIGGALSFNF